jgi:N-acetylneuraminate synthase
MNTIDTILPAVELLKDVPLAVLHCTSEYPTPYEHVRLGALKEIQDAFPGVTIGLSDHSMGIYTALGSVALGAMIVEKHFTLDRAWSGPDNAISIMPVELGKLVKGASAIYKALGGHKDILPGEVNTAQFAYACVVSTQSILRGEKLSPDNVWVKRPGTGEIHARDYGTLLGRIALDDIPPDTQLAGGMLE